MIVAAFLLAEDMALDDARSVRVPGHRAANPERMPARYELDGKI